MAEGSNGRRRFSDKWGKHELDVLAVLSSAFPQWLTSRQIAQRVKAYADSYGELADQAAKAAFAKQFQRDRAKLAAMGIAIESRQPEYSSKSEGQDFASYRLQLGDEPRIRLRFEQEDLPVLAAANYLARSISVSSTQSQTVTPQHVSRTTPRVPQTPIPGLGLDSIAPGLGTQTIPPALVRVVDSRRFAATVDVDGENINVAYTDSDDLAMFVLEHPGAVIVSPQEAVDAFNRRLQAASNMMLADRSSDDTGSATGATPTITRLWPFSLFILLPLLSFYTPNQAVTCRVFRLFQRPLSHNQIPAASSASAKVSTGNSQSAAMPRTPHQGSNCRWARFRSAGCKM